eukprot:5245047-Amphidinium_carterae.1
MATFTTFTAYSSDPWRFRLGQDTVGKVSDCRDGIQGTRGQWKSIIRKSRDRGCSPPRSARR